MLEGSVVSGLSIPAVQTFATKSFATELCPMATSGVDYSRLAFRTIGTVLKFQVTGQKNVTKIELTGNNGEALAGDKHFGLDFEVIGKVCDVIKEAVAMGVQVGVVVGGGNVAMDAARCSKRLGADVYVVYRRGMEELPARHEEVEHAIEEGVIFKTLNNPVQINGDEQDCVKSMTCIEMELGEPDASGRRRPVEKKGSEFELPVDAVIMSLGTTPNPLIKSTTKGLEVNKKGGIIVNEDGLTSRQGVYAGGDAVTGAATVILAMGAGKLGAKSIDEYLSNK